MDTKRIPNGPAKAGSAKAGLAKADAENPGHSAVARRCGRNTRGATAAAVAKLGRTRAGAPLGDITNVVAGCPGAAREACGKGGAAKPEAKAGAPRPRPTKKRLGPTFAIDASPSKQRPVGRCAAQGGEFEYAADIAEGLFASEKAALPREDAWQHDLNPKMRRILIDWLIDVHRQHKLSRATIFLAVNLLDRYLSRARISRARLQLCGVVSLLVASKFEDLRPPSVRSLAYMTDNSFTADQIKDFECALLAALEFKVFVPTAAHFLHHLLRSCRPIDPRQVEAACYVLELGLLDVRLLRFDPSLVAFSAVLVSYEWAGQADAIPAVAIGEARRQADDLDVLECASVQREMMLAARDGAVFKKYASQDRHAVALQRLAI